MLAANAKRAEAAAREPRDDVPEVPHRRLARYSDQALIPYSTSSSTCTGTQVDKTLSPTFALKIVESFAARQLRGSTSLWLHILCDFCANGDGEN